MLYLGRVNGTFSRDTEQMVFGLNIIMVLIFQEKDQVHGDIFYSLIPIVFNNGYVIWNNYTSV